MTGPEHYRQAEELLHIANQGHNVDSEREDRLTARAQVHATLALAAATAELDVYEGPNGGAGTGRSTEQVRAWDSARYAGHGRDGGASDD